MKKSNVAGRVIRFLAVVATACSLSGVASAATLEGAWQSNLGSGWFSRQGSNSYSGTLGVFSIQGVITGDQFGFQSYVNPGGSQAFWVTGALNYYQYQGFEFWHGSYTISETGASGTLTLWRKPSGNPGNPAFPGGGGGSGCFPASPGSQQSQRRVPAPPPIGPPPQSQWGKNWSKKRCAKPPSCNPGLNIIPPGTLDSVPDCDDDCSTSPFGSSSCTQPPAGGGGTCLPSFTRPPIQPLFLN
jgi:hypothetical protein